MRCPVPFARRLDIDSRLPGPVELYRENFVAKVTLNVETYTMHNILSLLV